MARLYVMQALDGAIKLGRSVDPWKRRGEVANQIKDDGLGLVYQTEPIANANETEHLAHRVLALFGKHIRDEWFDATPEQAREAIRIAIRQAAGIELPLGGNLKRVVDAKTKVVTLRIDDGFGEAAQRLADKDRRKLSSFLALIVEDGVRAMTEAEKVEKPSKRKA